MGYGLDVFARLLFVSFALVWRLVSSIIGIKKRHDQNQWNGN